MGVFEMEKFAKGTKAVADAVVKATDNGGFADRCRASDKSSNGLATKRRLCIDWWWGAPRVL